MARKKKIGCDVGIVVHDHFEDLYVNLQILKNHGVFNKIYVVASDVPNVEERREQIEKFADFDVLTGLSDHDRRLKDRTGPLKIGRMFSKSKADRMLIIYQDIWLLDINKFLVNYQKMVDEEKIC